MPEPELHGPQVLSTAVDQCRLGPAQRMRAELLRVPADEAYQALHDPWVLPDRTDMMRTPGKFIMGILLSGPSPKPSIMCVWET